MNFSKPRILLVDDKTSNRFALRTLLKGVDAELHEAANGFDALSMSLTEDYALILLDVQMPEMDGFEVCEQLRADPRTASTPVIFLTAAYKEAFDKMRGYLVGATDYLTKPIDDNILKAKVKVFLKLFEQQRLLQENNENLQIAATVFESQEGMFITDAENGIIRVNRAFIEITGYDSEEVKGKNPRIFKSGRHSKDFYSEMWKSIALSGSWKGEIWNRRKNGDVFPAFLTITAINSAEGIVTNYSATLIDISEHKRAEEKLQLAASVFTHAQEGIMITAADGAIIDANDAFCRITGYNRDEVLGQNPRLLSSGRHEPGYYASMWKDLLGKGHWQGELWNQRKNGDKYAVMETISSIRDDHGNTSHFVALFSDITSIKEHERELDHGAHYDMLTNLPNRVLLADRMQQGIAQARRRGLLLGVAFVDFDGFKAINDDYGHETGDQLLIALASRMKQTLREGDTLARMGGDEFVVILLDLTEIEASVPMLTRLLAAAAEPVQLGEITLQVSASIGVTFYPQKEAVDIDGDQLLRQADQAMYQAKQAGRNRYHIFDVELDRNIRGRYENIENIRQALAAGEFVLYYQPKVNMRTGAVTGAEALIRWQHPEKGLLSPMEFLPEIEDNLLAIDIGEWVIDTALTQMDIWQAAGLNIPVSVNVGARQLQQMDFVERLSKMLAAHPNVRWGNLELEVLETSALKNLKGVSRIIESCQKIGVLFAMDDFGAGYSSLTYFKHLPVTTIKIDQTFVRNMLNDMDDMSILRGVLSLSSAFHREVIAEGVETIEHGAMLLHLGCELAQGYGIAHPMPADELPGWMDAWRPDLSWAGINKD